MSTTELFGLKYRLGNDCDWHIIDAIIDKNEYRLGEFTMWDAIIDVGAHIGAFSVACLRRGAGYVAAYECAQSNFILLQKNLAEFPGRATVHLKAVWRSDIPETMLAYTGPGKGATGGENHGGGNVVFNDGQNIPVESIGLDAVLREFPDVRLLKLDCEASEWPILFTSKELGRVRQIVGEFHEIGGEFNDAKIPEAAAVEGFPSYTCEALVSFLERLGFSVETHRPGKTNIGLFFATR